jgi:hypothetical protein
LNETLAGKDLDLAALGTAIQFPNGPFCSGSRNCQSSGLCILDRLLVSIVLLRSHFIQCSSWYLRQLSAAHPPTTEPGLPFDFRDCTCFAEFPCIALGTHTQLVLLQNALFAIIAASYDLFKSMCASSDYAHKLS